MQNPLPITLFTGFLGSGKTTLIARLATQPGFGGSAILVNEIGEVGLDQLLLGTVASEVAVLADGCICCTMRGDLGASLRDLLRRKAAGELHSISQVIIETTGLADPWAAMRNLVADPILSTWYAPERVIATVDGVHGLEYLEGGFEAARQIAAADIAVVTKTALSTDAKLDALATAIRAINPTARLLFDREPIRADALTDRTRYTLPGEPPRSPGGGVNPGHLARYGMLSLLAERKLTWDRLLDWVEEILAMRPGRVLRMKGIVDVDGADGPLFINGVQELFYPPMMLPGWPSEDRRSRIVVIGETIDAAAIRRRFNRSVLGLNA